MKTLLQQLTFKQKLGLLATAFSIVAFFNLTTFSISSTPSLPERYFLTVKGLRAQRGDIVAIEGHTTAYHPQPLPYMKRLVGVAGDRIEIHGKHLIVAGHVVGRLYPRTRDGRALTPLKLKQIPPGFVFVAGRSWDSLDSRYQEFGLVRQEHLKGKSWGFGKR